MSKRLFAVMLVLLVLAVPFSANAQEPTVNPLPLTISVSGEGTAYANPDIAYLSMGVEIIDPDVTTAVNLANEQVAGIRAALEAAGIPAADVRTENFYIYRETFYNPEGGPSGAGTFHVSHILRVTVRDTAAVPQVLQAALEAGVNSINSVQYDIADRASVESQARALAVEDARAVATELAGLMGVQVGEVVSISESNVVLPYAAGMGGGGGGMMADVSAPPVEGGSLAVSVTVSITFDLVR